MSHKELNKSKTETNKQTILDANKSTRYEREREKKRKPIT